VEACDWLLEPVDCCERLAFSLNLAVRALSLVCPSEGGCGCTCAVWSREDKPRGLVDRIVDAKREDAVPELLLLSQATDSPEKRISGSPTAVSGSTSWDWQLNTPPLAQSRGEGARKMSKGFSRGGRAFSSCAHLAASLKGSREDSTATELPQPCLLDMFSCC